MKILITGKNGQVGWELERILGPVADVIALDRAQLDLSNEQQLVETVRGIKPNIIINAAAYTAVDKAETEIELAHHVNAMAPKILAEEAKRLNSLLIHYSTDYIFDGAKTTAYTEDDLPNPLNVYGKTKLDGENAIRSVDGNYLILRTSWVYGARGKNFLLTILRLMKEKKELRIVADQMGAPTWSTTIARTTKTILEKLDLAKQENEQKNAKKNGLNTVYHLSSSGQTTWHDFASSIARITNSDTKVTAITTEDYPLPARRPKNSLLDNSKLFQVFGLKLPYWEEDLAACIKTMTE